MKDTKVKKENKPNTSAINHTLNNQKNKNLAAQIKILKKEEDEEIKIEGKLKDYFGSEDIDF